MSFSEDAAAVLHEMEGKQLYAKKLEKIRKALGFLETDPRHPGLNTHKYQSVEGPNKEPVFEAYVENDTPGAWRIWFWYGPQKGHITVLAIGPHPD